jgi:hypothetical protein
MSDEARSTIAAFRRGTQASAVTRAETWARLQARIAADETPAEIDEPAARVVAMPRRAIAIGLATAAAVALAVWAWPWGDRVVASRDAALSEAVDGVATSPPLELVAPDRGASTAALPQSSAPAPVPIVPLPPVPPAPRAKAVAPASEVVAPGADALAREVALVQSAREAALAGDLERALDRTDAHAREFPRGKLAPERWALRIDLLCRLDREASARATAIAFASAHPESTIAAERRRDACPQKP